MSNAYGILEAFSTTKAVKINLKAKHGIDFKSRSNNKDTSTCFPNPQKADPKE